MYCFGKMLVTIWSILIFLLHFSSSQQQQPNIIIIVGDDVGWNDVAFHGSNQVPTPNIDALAYSGVILNNYYVMQMCTPSRSALMTGRHPIHTGMQHFVIFATEPWGLDLNEKLLPEYLKEQGYATHIVGKWHLGFFHEAYAPTFRGFDSHFGYWTSAMDYYTHSDNDQGFGEYATRMFTTEAERLISTHDTSRPLFLYLPHLAVHAANAGEPAQAPQETIDLFPDIADPVRRIFAGRDGKYSLSAVQVSDVAVALAAIGRPLPSSEVIMSLRNEATLVCQDVTVNTCRAPEGETCLFDVKLDPCESLDVAAQHPLVLAAMLQLLDDYNATAGWNDVAFHGSNQVPTPNIDALAYSGVILNNYYVMHLWMQHLVIYASEPWGLDLNEKLLPEYLKEQGYATHIVGKWHLGFFHEAYTPTFRGFDSHFGYWISGMDYYTHSQYDALERRGMLENSIIIFTTDNGGCAGGYEEMAASNWPLRGTKKSMWEGAVRGSALIWSPLLRNTPRVSSQLSHVQDWLPTLMAAISANVTLLDLDGVDLWPALNDPEVSTYDNLLINIDDITQQYALRMGDWKIVKGWLQNQVGKNKICNTDNYPPPTLYL
ncbi:hypothetical protein B566_EDAN008255 [Ephemera danica]|nr:hypothetical protein B566_EDAN008255 [Ephemera danica]